MNGNQLHIDLQNIVRSTIKHLTYYAFLFFFGFLVCYIWAHSQREELAHRIIKLEAGNVVIEQLCSRTP